MIIIRRDAKDHQSYYLEGRSTPSGTHVDFCFLLRRAQLRDLFGERAENLLHLYLNEAREVELTMEVKEKIQ